MSASLSSVEQPVQWETWGHLQKDAVLDLKLVEELTSNRCDRLAAPQSRNRGNGSKHEQTMNEWNHPQRRKAFSLARLGVYTSLLPCV